MKQLNFFFLKALFISHCIRKYVIMSRQESRPTGYSAGIPPGLTPASLAVSLVDNFLCKSEPFFPRLCLKIRVNPKTLTFCLISYGARIFSLKMCTLRFDFIGYFSQIDAMFVCRYHFIAFIYL